MADETLFLGLDLSTQGLKATILDASLEIVYERAVNFDSDLPRFETEGGVHRHDDGVTVTSPALMWTASVDLLLSQMREEGAPLDQVAAISGSGQQHGSVWLNGSAAAVLGSLDPARTLEEQLRPSLSLDDSPMWMDTSTSAECVALEKALGGAQAVADLTGSRAYERFTGNQIARISRTRPEVYDATDRICLVSSYVPSLLIGGFAPIDTSDGSGMNLLDISTRDWSDAALDATAPGLVERLGRPVAGHETVGSLSAYYVDRYGFSPACSVIAFSGDNPNSLAGLRLQAVGDLAISLGTSDTVFGSLSEPQPSGEEGHIFANPVDPRAYMAMIVRQNGSLVREAVRDAVAEGSWDTFGELLRQTPPGNNGCIGMYFHEPEITPPVKTRGTHRFDAEGNAVDSFAPAVEIRALLEGEFLSLRLHCKSVGLEPTRLIATGGASVNRGLIRVIADVFGAAIYIAEKADSASLGAAYRALHGWQCSQAGHYGRFAHTLAAAKPFVEAAKPDAAAHEAYTDMLPRIAGIEEKIS